MQSHDEQYVAVVHAADGVRFVARAHTANALATELADYVRERCDDVLWPPAAMKVHELLTAARLRAAIDVYFDNVGSRWDLEQLELSEPSTQSAVPRRRRSVLQPVSTD